MLTQRWLLSRTVTGRRTSALIRASYEAASIGAGAANAFVKLHHYSGTPVYDRYCYGLFRAGTLAGVAIFSHPTNEKVFAVFEGASVRQNLELGRFCLLDEVEGNGESWFLGQCFRLLKRERDKQTGGPLNPQGVIAFSDPCRAAPPMGAW
jgi:hypothetical protein